MPNHGSFSGNPKTEWLTDGAVEDRNMRLLEDFEYRDPAGRTWPAPAGVMVNGASIPEPLWTLVGSPYVGHYRRATVVHDVACEDPSVDRKEADVMFFHACRCGGCSLRQAWLLYVGVRFGAWFGIEGTTPSIGVGLPTMPDTHATLSEAELLERFEQVAEALEGLDEGADLAEIDALIEQSLPSDP